MAAGLAAPATAATQHKPAPHGTTHAAPKKSSGAHAAPKHAGKAPPSHGTSHSSAKHHTASRKSYHHYSKPKPKPAPGIRADGRYVLPGGMETTCAGGTPPPCR